MIRWAQVSTRVLILDLLLVIMKWYTKLLSKVSEPSLFCLVSLQVLNQAYHYVLNRVLSLIMIQLTNTVIFLVRTEISLLRLEASLEPCSISNDDPSASPSSVSFFRAKMNRMAHRVLFLSQSRVVCLVNTERWSGFGFEWCTKSHIPIIGQSISSYFIALDRFLFLCAPRTEPSYLPCSRSKPSDDHDVNPGLFLAQALIATMGPKFLARSFAKGWIQLWS